MYTIDKATGGFGIYDRQCRMIAWALSRGLAQALCDMMNATHTPEERRELSLTPLEDAPVREAGEHRMDY